MTIKGQISGIVIILVALGVMLYQRPLGSDTLNRIQILEDTNEYVEVRAGDKTGRLYKEFAFDFDEPVFTDWFFDRGWNAMTLLSPANPTVEEYAALGRSIINGDGSFVDNSVTPFQNAARFEAVAPADGMVTSKSDLQNTSMWFVKGDDLWFRASFLLEQGVPYSLVDFEDNSVRQSPGIRIVIDDNRYIGIELKSGRKPRLRQAEYEIPTGRWFTLTLHLRLDDTAGIVRIWQDDQLIINDKMKTLPNAESLLNSFEIGITATDQAAVLLLDDVMLSHNPF
ncbi:MAG: hypothetical protein L3J33_07845 [Rhodobacteraceae bacterium]|nr:hypothetical protein [Paracoccaceae bacterium]